MEIKSTLAYNNKLCVVFLVYQTRKIKTRYNSPLNKIWGDIKYHLTGGMIYISGMTTSLAGHTRGLLVYFLFKAPTNV